MIQLAPQTRVLVAIDTVDFRCGIDGLAQVCRARLHQDPFTGVVFAFRNRRRTAVKLLVYDGQGFWLCHKRLSKGTFRWWPSTDDDAPAAALLAHELHVLLRAGDPRSVRVAPEWRAVAWQISPGAGGDQPEREPTSPRGIPSPESA